MPVPVQHKMIQCAANLAAVAQTKSVQIVPILYERHAGPCRNAPAVLQRLHKERPVDLADGTVDLIDRVPDRLIARKTAVATDYDPLRTERPVKLILKRHRLIQPESLQLALCKLMLNVLQVAQRVLGEAGG
jgi:hypothetical protein